MYWAYLKVYNVTGTLKGKGIPDILHMLLNRY